MDTPQIIQTDAGDELVVLSRRDYDALLARAGDIEAENAMTRRIVAETSAAIHAGEDVVLTERDWQYLECSKNNRLFALRVIRKMTQAELSAASGVGQAHISMIEANKKGFSTDTMQRLARALRVPMDVLVG